MAQLQKPPYVWMNGTITPWDDAKIHVGSEALIRGISVFEGIKGYWRHDGAEFGLLSLRKHYERLKRSALVQELPFAMAYEEYLSACSTLCRKLRVPDRDLWMRTTLFSAEGHWGENTVSDLVITAYHQDKKRADTQEIGFSTWQRPLDTALPARVKSAANYQIARLARIEGRRQGFTDMAVLNAWGRVAEASASSILIARNGRIATPPPHEGCLESITVDIVEALCASLDIPFERRPIERTELMVADAACLAGTVTELAMVRRVGTRSLPVSHPLFDRIIDTFYAGLRGRPAHPAMELTAV
jgi:branched-chain amino acid aminotransferase